MVRYMCVIIHRLIAIKEEQLEVYVIGDKETRNHLPNLFNTTYLNIELKWRNSMQNINSTIYLFTFTKKLSVTASC